MWRSCGARLRIPSCSVSPRFRGPSDSGHRIFARISGARSCHVTAGYLTAPSESKRLRSKLYGSANSITSSDGPFAIRLSPQPATTCTLARVGSAHGDAWWAAPWRARTRARSMPGPRGRAGPQPSARLFPTPRLGLSPHSVVVNQEERDLSFAEFGGQQRPYAAPRQQATLEESRKFPIPLVGRQGLEPWTIGLKVRGGASTAVHGCTDSGHLRQFSQPRTATDRGGFSLVTVPITVPRAGRCLI